MMPVFVKKIMEFRYIETEEEKKLNSQSEKKPAKKEDKKETKTGKK